MFIPGAELKNCATANAGIHIVPGDGGKTIGKAGRQNGESGFHIVILIAIKAELPVGFHNGQPHLPQLLNPADPPVFRDALSAT